MSAAQKSTAKGDRRLGECPQQRSLVDPLLCRRHAQAGKSGAQGRRKSNARAGKKLPENLRSAGVKFSELTNSILTYSALHHRDTRNIESRIAKVLPDFGERVAASIKPEESDAWFAAHTKTAATANRYRALFSLAFRELFAMGRSAATRHGLSGSATMTTREFVGLKATRKSGCVQ